jgi:hypothetical protein
MAKGAQGMTQFLKTIDGGLINVDDIKAITYSRDSHPFAVLADGDSRGLANFVEVLKKVLVPRARAAISAEEARADEFIRHLAEAAASKPP